jgi:hypothetical protein
MYMITKRIVSLIKKYRLTAILINQNSPVYEGNLTTMAKVSSLFHNIIILRYIEVNFRMKRSIVFLKMRSSYHDNSILEFVISGDGVKIIGPMNDYAGTSSDIKQVIYHEPQKTGDEIRARPPQDKRKKLLSKFDRDDTGRVKREIMERKKRGEKKEEKNLSIDDKKNVRDKNHIKQE